MDLDADTRKLILAVAKAVVLCLEGERPLTTTLDPERERLLAQPVGILGFSNRARHSLSNRLNCKTVGDVTKLQEWDLKRTRGLGGTTFREIRTTLEKHGLSLAPPTTP